MKDINPTFNRSETKNIYQWFVADSSTFSIPQGMFSFRGKTAVLKSDIDLRGKKRQLK